MKKCDGFTFILVGLFVQWQGLKISVGRSKAARKLSGSGARLRGGGGGGLVWQVCYSGMCQLLRPFKGSYGIL